jgi:hypothetical protein
MTGVVLSGILFLHSRINSHEHGFYPKLEEFWNQDSPLHYIYSADQSVKNCLVNQAFLCDWQDLATFSRLMGFRFCRRRKARAFGSRWHFHWAGDRGKTAVARQVGAIFSSEICDPQMWYSEVQGMFTYSSSVIWPRFRRKTGNADLDNGDTLYHPCQILNVSQFSVSR